MKIPQYIKTIGIGILTVICVLISFQLKSFDFVQYPDTDSNNNMIFISCILILMIGLIAGFTLRERYLEHNEKSEAKLCGLPGPME